MLVGNGPFLQRIQQTLTDSCTVFDVDSIDAGSAVLTIDEDPPQRTRTHELGFDQLITKLGDRCFDDSERVSTHKKKWAIAHSVDFRLAVSHKPMELVAKGGIEPPTRGFSVRCSTN